MSLLSTIGKTITDVGRVATGFATGGPLGGLGAIASLGGGPKPGTAVTVAGIASRLPSPFTGVVPPGGSSAINNIFGLAPIAPNGAGGCPKGYHLNKHALPACKSHQAVPARSLCVRNRHANPANGRAIMRAIRRVKRGEKVFRKVYSIVHHKAGAVHIRRGKKR